MTINRDEAQRIFNHLQQALSENDRALHETAVERMERSRNPKAAALQYLDAAITSLQARSPRNVETAIDKLNEYVNVETGSIINDIVVLIDEDEVPIYGREELSLRETTDDLQLSQALEEIRSEIASEGYKE